jgi:aspartate/methionine/tyrosine aminotransferase
MTHEPGFPELAYLAWAMRRYGQVQFDLASSGLSPLPVDAVGPATEIFCGANDPKAPFLYQAAVAKRFDVPIDHAIPAVGTTHGLFCAYAALLARGDHVLVESPTYEPLVRAAEALGAKVIPFVRDLSRGAAFDVDEIGRMLNPRVRVVAIANLHNPTGAHVSDDDVRALAAVCAKNGTTLLVDEVYRDLVDFDAKHGATAHHLADNVVTTSSLTKVYGLPWLRAGWVLARKPIAERVMNVGLHTIGAVSWSLASAGVRALERLDEIHAMSKLARAHDDNAFELVRAFLAERPHFSLTRHRGSIFGFVVDTRGGDLTPAIERAIDEEGVIVAPGKFFGHPSGFRLRYGAMPIETLEKGLQALGRALG